MKTLLTTLFLLLCVSLSAQQSGLAIYKKKRMRPSQKKIDSLIKTGHSFSKEFLKSTFEQERIIAMQEYSLKFNKAESLFTFNDNLDLDEDEFNAKIARIVTFANSIYYTNRTKNEIITFRDLAGEAITKTKPLDSLKWKLINKTKIIGKYKCYKATTSLYFIKNKKTITWIIEAWYAPNIPFQYGPNGCVGLPGLIVELKEGSIITYLSKLTLSKKNIKIKNPIK